MKKPKNYMYSVLPLSMPDIHFVNSRADVKDVSKWYQPQLSLAKKVEKLISESGNLDFIDKGDIVAIKTHFGERGTTKTLRPIFIRKIVNAVRERGGKPFVTETTGLGLLKDRCTAIGRLKIAEENGYTAQTLNAPIMIADGIKGYDYVGVDIIGKHIKNVKVARAIIDSDAVICATHFKLHMMAGIGGSIKNIGVGCVAKPSKFDLHCSEKPKINENCNQCGDCIDVCPTSAISDFRIYPNRCIKCGACDEVCKNDAIELNWLTGKDISERIVECASGVMKTVENFAFFNFAVDITPHCDCHPYSDNSIVPDIGVFASNDIVAIDKACYDAFLQSRKNPDSLVDNFWEGTDALTQITYSEMIGLGKSSYEVLEL